MLKIRISREVLVKAIMYHADKSEDLTPIIEDDSDLREWTRRLILDWTSEDDVAWMTFTAEGDTIIIGGSNDVIDAIKSQVL